VVLVLALAAIAAAQPPVEQPLPIGAKLTLVRSLDALPYFNPALAIKGTLEPSPGNRLVIVEFTIGANGVEAGLASFVLTTSADASHTPIAAGGGSNLTFPVARIPVGQEMGQILPTDAIVAVKRLSATSAAIEAGPIATIALVYDVPKDAAPRTLKLPDGSVLGLER